MNLNQGEIKAFEQECQTRIASYPNTRLATAAEEFIAAATEPKYCYNFSFLGRPIIQYPQDMVAVQELIWDVKPDLIIETGIAHGGSLIMSAAMLALIEYCDAVESGSTLDPNNPVRKVLGLDIDIRSHNRNAVEQHPMSKRIEMFQGSSIDPQTIEKVRSYAAPFERVLVFLDSNHTHSHVLEELNAYAPLVHPGSYCVVFDTIIEDLDSSKYPDRPWGPGNNPKTAVHEFLKTHAEFEINQSIDNKLLISVAPHGFLKRV